MMVVVLSFCGFRIGSLLLVRKLVFWLDSVISVGLVSMWVMLLFCSSLILVFYSFLVELNISWNVEEIGDMVLLLLLFFFMLGSRLVLLGRLVLGCVKL